MALETNVAALVTSVGQVRDLVLDRVGGHLEAAQTLEVGAGKQFPDLQSAWDSLIGKVISKKITIQVDDGVYESKRISLRFQPYAEKIIILGNLANPEQCVIDIKPNDVDGRPIGIECFNVRNVQISGFKFQNATVAGGEGLGLTGGIGLSVGGHSRVFSAADSLIFENCDTGIRVSTQSFASCLGARFILCGIAASASGYSYGAFSRADITGPGWDPDPSLSGRSLGLVAQYGSFVQSQDAIIRNCYYGIFAFSNGSIGWCRGARVENARHGFLAQWNGLIDAQISISPGSLEQDPEGVGCRAEGCEQGFHSVDMGNVFCQRSVADGCVYGYVADRGSQLRADSSSALNSTAGAYRVGHSSLVYAYLTQANLSGNAADYNVASGVQGSAGGWMHYS